MTKTKCPSCGVEFDTEPVFSRAQIAKMTTEEYEEKRAEILKAMIEGRIK